MNTGLDPILRHLEKLSKLPRPYRMAMLPALAALVVGAYVYFFYLPSQQELAQVEAQQMQLQRKLNEVRSVTENLAQFEQELVQLDQQLTLALRQLPNSKELPGLLTDVSMLGKNAGLDIRVFRPGDEVGRDFYAEVPIEVEFTGHFHDIVRFFDEVSRLPRIVNVGELDIKIGEEDSLGTVLDVKGQARTFRFVEGASAGAVAAVPAAGAATPAQPAQRGH